jgi:hypothetical protein
LKITSPVNATGKTLTNIAFGDVYLCSGSALPRLLTAGCPPAATCGLPTPAHAPAFARQSNMQFSVNDAFNASAEIADSIHYPNLRLYTVAMVSNTPGLPSKRASLAAHGKGMRSVRLRLTPRSSTPLPKPTTLGQ